MHEIAKVTLETEMDLILAHRRSMRLGELAGLSLAAQTSFATAVSEVARNTIENTKGGCLVLQVDTDGREKYIVACINDKEQGTDGTREGLRYARRLVDKYNVVTKGLETSVELYYYCAPAFKMDFHKLDEWRSVFRNERPISAYDELKRKNYQLQELSEKLQKSEEQYKTLTNSLPMIIFSLDSDGQLTYANEWLNRFTGQSLEALNESRWQSVVHADDYASFSLLLNNDVTSGGTTVKIQARLRQKHKEEYLWHQVSLSPFENDKGELQYWIGYIVDIHAQKVFEETLQDNLELKQAQAELKENQQTLEKYIVELGRSNQELQQFAFVASHDLQEPVRKLLFYSDSLLSQYAEQIDPKGADYLKRIHTASARMRNLIKDLLHFSQINKEEIEFTEVDLNRILTEAMQDYEMVIEEKGALINSGSLPVVPADERMMRQLFENIISNALKYCKPERPPVIDIHCIRKDGMMELSFRDNGIGFEQQYVSQMFTLFRRLHNRKVYEGTGLGLAICRKIVDLHAGHIWAESTEGAGAVFYVSIPAHRNKD